MPTRNSSMKMTQRQSQKMVLKQIPGMVTVLKLREHLFSASGNELEDFLLRFTEDNRFLSRTPNSEPGDAVLYPRFLSEKPDRSHLRSVPPVDNRSVSDILEATASSPSTLKTVLTEQLRLERLTPEETEIGELLISGLDDNGYWIYDPETGETFPESEKKRHPQNAVLLDRLTAVIRRLDPPGAAVKNRFESAAVVAADNPDEYPDEAVRFYRRLFELTENGTDWNQIPQLLNEEFGAETVAAIGNLPVPQPPGTGFSRTEDKIPDATAVTDGKNQISVSVPADRLLRRLKLDEDHPRDSEEFRTAEAVLYAVEERCRLLKAAVGEIVRRQLPYITGEHRSKTRLTRAEIADTLEIDRPKLTRLLKNKTVRIGVKEGETETPSRTMTAEISSFFDRSGSGSLSREEITAAMKRLVKTHGPLNDTQMSRLLKLQGIDIHRRTVCKYRSQINKSFSGGNYGTIHSGNSL